MDTAQYYLKVDDNEETIRTGGDGYWGGYMELSRTINGPHPGCRHHLDFHAGRRNL